jgi:hypothetical protein
MQATLFNILRISAGRVLVDINAPEKAAIEIQRQSLDPNSRYKKTKSVTRLRSLLALLVLKIRGSPRSQV